MENVLIDNYTSIATSSNHTHTRAHARTHAHTHTHARTHARTHAHTHTHVGTVTQRGTATQPPFKLANLVCYSIKGKNGWRGGERGIPGPRDALPPVDCRPTRGQAEKHIIIYRYKLLFPERTRPMLNQTCLH